MTATSRFQNASGAGSRETPPASTWNKVRGALGRQWQHPLGHGLSNVSLDLTHGCAGRCRYCYHAARLPGAEVHSRATVEQKIEWCLRSPAPLIFISELSDPYPSREKEVVGELSRFALNYFVERRRAGVTIVTKGGTRAVRDFDLLEKLPGAVFVSSIVFSDERTARSWEPGCAAPAARLEAIAEAKRRGLRAHLSLDPVLDQAEALRVAERVAGLIDGYNWSPPFMWGALALTTALRAKYDDFVSSIPPLVMRWVDFKRELGAIMGFPGRSHKIAL